MRNVMCLVLGGGKGTRLFPLTQYRSKPAVPLAGKYRIIDIPISNCIHSGLNRIYLLTQFNSVSLHRHIRESYRFDRFDGGFVEILAAQQTMEGDMWYQGTADAVRKNLRYLQQPGIDYVLILSGDQLYRMNYADMIATHEQAGADATIATVPVTAEQASAFGILQFDDSGRVIGFKEKPKTEEELKPVRTDPAWIDAHGIQSKGRDCLANMGIYLFNRDLLVDLLTKTTHEDFGKEVFPEAIKTHRVQVHLFDGYWEDIGTIRSFYEANLALAGKNPPFQFVVDNKPIYSRARFLQPTRLDGATIRNTLLADGCVIEEGATIENSVIGLRCHIGRNVTIRNSIVMGADYFQLRGEKSGAAPHDGGPPLGIAENTLIDGAIIDKNCRIGRGVQIAPFPNMDANADMQDGILIRDGVICVPKESLLPDGWRLG